MRKKQKTKQSIRPKTCRNRYILKLVIKSVLLFVCIFIAANKISFKTITHSISLLICNQQKHNFYNTTKLVPSKREKRIKYYFVSSKNLQMPRDQFGKTNKDITWQTSPDSCMYKIAFNS